MDFKNSTKEFEVTKNELKIENFKKEESLMSIGNGLIVSRGTNDELRNYEYRETYMNGFFNKANKYEVEELVNLPDVFEYELYVNNQLVVINENNVKNYLKTLNLKYGYLIRTYEIKVKKTTLTIKTLKYFDQVARNNAVFEIEIKADTEAEIKFVDKIDATYTNNGSEHFIYEEKTVDNNALEYYTKTINDNELYIKSYLEANKDLDNTYLIKRKKISRTSKVNISENEELKIKKVITYSTNNFENITENKTKHEQKRTELFDQVYIKIDNKTYQNALNISIYHLLLNANLDSSDVNLAAKGLTGHGYKGHVFWDTEILLLPFYITNFPQKAKNLLIYRAKSLNQALLKAKSYNYKGAMFSWEQTRPNVGDQTPLYGPINIQTKKAEKIVNSEIEIHINHAIIYGLDYYYEQTKDIKFMNEYAAEMLIQNAIFLISRLTYNREYDYYEILNVIGPDEYKEHVDNNAYINYMTKYNLNLITKYLKLNVITESDLVKHNITIDEIKMYEDKIKIQQPNDELLINQNDTFLNLEIVDLTQFKKANNVAEINKKYSMAQKNKIQVSKQADLVLLFQIFKDLYSKEILLTNFKYYEDKCLHDSSLSLSTHSIVAADLDLIDFSKELFERSFKIDLSGSINSSTEGIHFASMGGMWLCIVRGFCQINSFNGLDISPKLPMTINNINLNYIYESNKLEIELTKEYFTIKNKGLKEVEFTSFKKNYNIKPGEKLNIKIDS